jgi:hypothetical protein
MGKGALNYPTRGQKIFSQTYLDRLNAVLNDNAEVFGV